MACDFCKSTPVSPCPICEVAPRTGPLRSANLAAPASKIKACDLKVAAALGRSAPIPRPSRAQLQPAKAIAQVVKAPANLGSLAPYKAPAKPSEFETLRKALLAAIEERASLPGADLPALRKRWKEVRDMKAPAPIPPVTVTVVPPVETMAEMMTKPTAAKLDLTATLAPFDWRGLAARVEAGILTEYQAKQIGQDWYSGKERNPIVVPAPYGMKGASA